MINNKIVFQYFKTKTQRFRILSPATFSKKMLAEYHQYKEASRILVEARLSYFNRFYGFEINRISIKKQKTRWGSCSIKKNLNFNYKILFLPSDLADYIIVHELCHLQEFNHSYKFWYLVSLMIPNYLDCRRRLNTHQYQLN